MIDFENEKSQSKREIFPKCRLSEDQSLDRILCIFCIKFLILISIFCLSERSQSCAVPQKPCMGFVFSRFVPQRK